MNEDEEYWIYHERQVAMLCGQHALNNLVQACVFSAESLADLAHQLDQVELTYMAQNNEGGIHSKDFVNRVAEGSGNVDPSGNFSIEVLRAALRSRYGLDLPNIRQEGVLNSVSDVTEMEGFICNRDAHWFAIRKIHGRFWNLNSMQECPEIVSHFQLATTIETLQKSGYSVFCVPRGLPPPHTSSTQAAAGGPPQFWWKEQDLLLGKTSTKATKSADPWKDVGSGMRLDGKESSSSAFGNGTSLGDMTEEEMLQMALAQSLEPTMTNNSGSEAMVPLTPEPTAGTPNVVSIQFRLPGGGRSIRRFLQSDPVKMLYTFVDQTVKDGQGRRVELRFGFPPKDLSTVSDKTVGEAGLAGENIQCRFL